MNEEKEESSNPIELLYWIIGGIAFLTLCEYFSWNSSSGGKFLGGLKYIPQILFGWLLIAILLVAYFISKARIRHSLRKKREAADIFQSQSKKMNFGLLVMIFLNVLIVLVYAK